MTKKQIGLIFKPIAFIAGLAVLLTVSGFALNPNKSYNWQKGYNVSVDEEVGSNIDYVFLGDSLVLRGISPMEIWKEYGFAGYNLGSSEQRLSESILNLKNFFENHSPKVVFLETNAIFRRHPKIINECNFTTELLLKRQFPVFQYHSTWKNIDSLVLKKSAYKKSPTESRGFDFSKKKNPYLKGPYVKSDNSKRGIGDVQKKYLSIIAQLCKENDAKLILYSTPSPVCWNYGTHNTIEEYAKEKEIVYLDMNLELDKIGIDWENDTYDRGDHMNLYGAKKVSVFLGEYMKNLEAFEDHRNDLSYESWNKELERYIENQKIST